MGIRNFIPAVDFQALLHDYSISALIRHTGGLDQTVIGSIGTSSGHLGWGMTPPHIGKWAPIF